MLTKIDEILAWKQQKEAERDTRFVELGKQDIYRLQTGVTGSLELTLPVGSSNLTLKVFSADGQKLLASGSTITASCSLRPVESG